MYGMYVKKSAKRYLAGSLRRKLLYQSSGKKTFASCIWRQHVVPTRLWPSTTPYVMTQETTTQNFPAVKTSNLVI